MTDPSNPINLRNQQPSDISKRRERAQDALIKETLKNMLAIKDDRDIAPIQWGCGRSTSKVHKKKHWKQTFKTTTMTDPGKKKYKFRKTTSFKNPKKERNYFLK